MDDVCKETLNLDFADDMYPRFSLKESQKLSKLEKIPKSLGYAKKIALMQNLPTKCKASTNPDKLGMLLAVFLGFCLQ